MPQARRDKEDLLLRRIPEVPSLQAAWLLLLFCASPRANYFLRVLPPADTQEYAASHDVAVLSCLASLLSGGEDFPGLQARLARLPLRGLRSAERLRFAAHWGSWADCLPVLHARSPLLGTACSNSCRVRPAPNRPASRQPANLRTSFVPADSPSLAGPPLVGRGLRPPADPDRQPGDLLHGWQHAASRCALF